MKQVLQNLYSWTAPKLELRAVLASDTIRKKINIKETTYLLLQLQHNALTANKLFGYYMLEFFCDVLDVGLFGQMILLDNQQQVVESFNLKIHPNQVIKRVIWIPQTDVSVYFKLKSSEDISDSLKICLVKLSDSFAMRRMRKKLSFKALTKDQALSCDIGYPDKTYHVQSSTHSINHIQQKELNQRYDKVFPSSLGNRDYDTWLSMSNQQRVSTKKPVQSLQKPITNKNHSSLSHEQHIDCLNVLIVGDVDVHQRQTKLLDSISQQSHPYCVYQLIDTNMAEFDALSTNHSNKMTAEHQQATVITDQEAFDQLVDGIVQISIQQLHQLFVSGEMQARAPWLLVSADVCFTEHAFTELAAHFVKGADYELIYSDSDCVRDVNHDEALLTTRATQDDKITTDSDKNGSDVEDSFNRHSPSFKTQWNPDLLYSMNYIGHCFALSQSKLEYLLDMVLQDDKLQLQDTTDMYVLLLLFSLNAKPDKVLRIPQLLFHEATAYTQQKTYGFEKLSYVYGQYFTEVDSITTGYLPNTYKLNWQVDEDLQGVKVSLIIPTRDQVEVLKNCVGSILALTTYANYEIIIVDNQSEQLETKEYLDFLQTSQSNISVLDYPYEFNYSAINNFAVSHAKGDIIGLLNNDVQVISPEWLTEMVSHCLRKDVGCVGAKLYYANELIQHAGVLLGIGHVAGHAHRHFERDEDGYCGRLKVTQNYMAVTGACLLLRKSVYQEVGGLDEVNLKVAYNDVDLCLEVHKAGYRNLWTPYAELYHHESISRGRDVDGEKKARYLSEIQYMKRKWYERLLVDDFYNPNLSLKDEYFSFKYHD